MDPQKKQEIAAKIEDGSYYVDALEWYTTKYLTPVTERSLISIIAVLVLCLFCLSVFNIRKLSVEIQETPITIYVDHESPDAFSFIKPIAQRYEPAQDAVAKYLLKDYVITREKYMARAMSETSTIRKLMKKIKSSSSKSVLNEYQSYMNKTNPYSPFMRYQDHTNRTIKIDSFTFIGDDKTTGKAQVNFTATEQKLGSSEKSSSSKWQAVLHFRLPDVETIAQTGAPLRFLVKYYRVKPIK